MKPANLILLTLLISVLTINMLPLASYGQPVEGRVRNLNTGTTYDTIQEAINAANTGDTIYVSNGTYYEHVTLNKTVTLRGENKSNTIIDGGGSGNVISVSVDAVSISGFTIQNSGSTHPNAGVYVDDSENTRLSNNIIQKNARGIYLYSSDGNSVSDNLISGNYFFGIDIFSASNNVVSNNNITGNSYGIELSQSINNLISNNNVSLSIGNAIEITACVGNSFSGNSLSNNNNGFYVEISTDNYFSGNNVSKNQQGFYLITSSDNRIYGNNVSSNTNGVWLSSSFNNIFLNNYLINNQNSLNLITSNNNVIYHNNFINTLANTTQKPNVVGSVNSWDKDNEGNYWSNHERSDKNNDGIMETPYVIDGKNIDNYPLMANYTEFNITVGVRSFMVSIVSNSTISSFEYFYYPANRTAVVSFQVSNVSGKGFCRISVPHVLIAPPFTVMIDYNTSLSADIVHSNRTHSWIFFTYDHSEGRSSVILLLSQEQTAMWQFWFWTTMVLVAVVMVQFLLVTKYRQIADEQKEAIRAYELKLQMYAREHFDTARRLFEVDVQRRKTKIEKFESKYNVKLRPSNSFEGIIKSMELKKKESKEEKRS